MRKKVLAVVLAASMGLLLFAACNSADQNGKESSAESSQSVESSVAESSAEESSVAESSVEESSVESTEVVEPEEQVMTYAEYAAAEVDDPVVIEAYVQANQSWWDGKITVYAQDKDGAYFLYNMACASQEDADKLVPGTKIKVSGFKAEWAGEIEISDATYEIVAGDTYVAEPVDVTELLGTDALIEKQNQKVAFKGMTVESEALYKWDGSGAEGDDLYFNVSVNGNTYTFTVESYLCGADTEVYKTVKGLKKGDVVDLEGFLYWYEGVNPHITAATVK
ncbi:MAG: hypothetical protein IK081_10970 [Lachnospiraceae bacterium]|nr:hypothetical protein [Lachnospiraceae bacterium]